VHQKLLKYIQFLPTYSKCEKGDVFETLYNERLLKLVVICKNNEWQSFMNVQQQYVRQGKWCNRVRMGLTYQIEGALFDI